MKLIHLSQTDAGSGAGRAAYRIHRSLLERGIDSSMLVGEKRTRDTTVHGIAEGAVTHFGVRVCQFLESKMARHEARGLYFFSPARSGYFNPASDARVQAADVVCLYWINGGFIRPEGFTGLEKPILWRLSDVWPFTGGCHYPGSCERFIEHCGECPQLAHPSGQDMSHHLLARKQSAWRELDLTIAAPSNWIAGLAKKSALFANQRIEVIPTGVDTEVYRPLDKAASRTRFKIPQDKTVILFGAMDMNDTRKGFKQLQDALGILAQSKFSANLLAVTFGKATTAQLSVPSMSLGLLHDDEALASAYSSADIVIVPSLEDNLPNVALEAIACGAPVVGFNVCGMPDIVRSGWNGALATVPDATSLAREIEHLLESADLRMFSANARVHALERFSLKQQAESYEALCRKIMEHHKH